MREALLGAVLLMIALVLTLPLLIGRPAALPAIPALAFTPFSVAKVEVPQPISTLPADTDRVDAAMIASDLKGMDFLGPEGRAVTDAHGQLVSWVMPVGRFSQHKRAVALSERLRAGRFPSHVREEREGSRVAYSVHAGPWMDRAEALEMQALIRKELGLKGGLERYRMEY